MRIDLAQRTVEHAATDNIEAGIYPAAQEALLTRSGGISAGAARKSRVTRLPCPANGMLIVHSDRYSLRWGREAIPQLAGHDIAMIGNFLVDPRSRHRDDASVVVVREAAA